jgi:DUF4097 and DUF4098 domain-containing protein YvlB
MRRAALFLFVLGLSTAAFAGDEVTETIERTLNVRPGTALEVDNVNGSLTITAWDQPRVRIHAVKKVSARNEEAAREALAALRVEIEQTDRVIRVDTHYPKRGDSSVLDMLFGGGENVNSSVKYEINVPRSMNVEADTVNGSIRVEGISGEIDLDTTNGKIAVANCSGSVDASTTNGGIDVELTAVTAGKEMSFETTNGRISLAVPSNLGAEINAATTNGSVRSDLPLVTHRFSRTSLKGTLNGGGPEIKLRTTNGGIEIRAAGGAGANS